MCKVDSDWLQVQLDQESKKYHEDLYFCITLDLLCTGALLRVYVVTLNHSAITSLYSFKKPPVKENISFPSKSHKEIAPLLA